MGEDILIGNQANTTYTGNEAADIFVIEANSCQDTITDFTDDEDLIDLTDLNIVQNFNDWKNANVSQSGSDVVIDFGGGNDLTLLGQQLADVTQDDFAF